MTAEIPLPSTPSQTAAPDEQESARWIRLSSSWRTLVILLLPAVLLVPFLNAPFEHDEAIYWVVAQGLFDGSLWYQGPWDHKPPLIFSWYALSFVAFGENVVAPRILAAFFFLGSTWIVFIQARLLLRRRAAFVAALTMGATAGLVMLQPAANAEVYTTFPAVLALLAATLGFRGTHRSEDGAWRWFLLAGLLSGIAVLTKQFVLLPTAAIGLVILFASNHRGRDAASFVGGGLVALVLTFIPFLLAGAWDDFFYANFTYNRLYFAADGPNPLTSSLRFVVIAAPFVVISAKGAISLWSTDRRAEGRLILLWSVASFASVFSTGRAYEHYWVMTFPAMALLAGYAMGTDFPRVPQRRTLKRAGFVAALSVATFISLSINLPAFLHASAEERHVAQYGSSGELDIQSEAVAARVAELLGPDDRFYEVGRETGIYFHSGVLPPVRFMFDRQFYLDPTTLDETMDHLRSEPPKLLLLTRLADDPPYTDGFVESATVGGRIVPVPIAAFLDEQYEFLERVEFADIYQLVDARQSRFHRLNPPSGVHAMRVAPPSERR